MDRLTWDWASEVNQQVPYITDWPPIGANGTGPLWNMMGQGDGAVAMSLFLQEGYIRSAG